MKKERKKISVKKGYEKWAKAYDIEANPLILTEEPFLEKLLSNLKGKKALDIGCGTGRWTIKLKRKGVDVIGIEPNGVMLKIAKRKYPKITFKKAGIYKIPFTKESFDFVICTLVLVHIKNLNRAIKEMSRVLKKGGTLIISDLHPKQRKETKKFWGEAIPYFTKTKIYLIKAPLYSLEDYLDAFKKARLKLIKMKELRLMDSRKAIENKQIRKSFSKKEFDEFKRKKFCIIFKLKKRS